MIEIHAAGWKDGGKSAAQWRASLRDYAMPRLGRRRVADISTADVMAVLLPIWNDKRETARRVRQRIGAVMKWAIAEGHRGDNPAGEAIGAALPKNGVVRQHQRALPHAEVGAALAKVRGSDACRATVLAFEFLVFPSLTGKALSDSTLSKLCRENAIGCVPHGMRSSFRDWAAECSNAPREVCELALAHVNSDRVEAAYRRSDLFERRRRLMETWASYLQAETGRVVPTVHHG